MPSPPTQSTSNKFRAEPFVNQFAFAGAAHSGDVGEPEPEPEPSDGGAREAAITARAVYSDEYEVDSQSRIRKRDPSRRISLANGNSVGPPSISDIQRASIASSASTNSSSARRSSYDPNEPGILEKIHTGQGKSKRNPIAVQQWTMMNTFKIRPATTEQVGPPIPLSVAPDRPVPSTDALSPVEDEVNLVFVAEGGSVNPIQHSPPIPRPVPIVVPPTTLLPPSTPAPAPRFQRKRPRYVIYLVRYTETDGPNSREEPNDPNIQVFYHEDVRPVNMDVITDQPGDKTATPPPSVSPLPPVVPTPSTPSAHVTPPITVTAPQPSSTIPTTQPNETALHQALLPTKYDPVERIFTLPETDPIERGGPPVKKWVPVYREIRTIGGGVCRAPTWTSTGEAATPMKPPPDFVPGQQPALGLGNSASGPGVSSSGFGGLMGAVLGTSGMASLAPVASSGVGPKRVKKVKSDISLGGGSGTVTPLTGGAIPLATTTKRKGPAPGTKKSKKATAGANAAPSIMMEPPLVSISQAVSDVDTEMREF